MKTSPQQMTVDGGEVYHIGVEMVHIGFGHCDSYLQDSKSPRLEEFK
jgi:hypothetical protein